jgi:hypothetical protein
MAAHACHRCGHDARCSHGTWADRPPWPAALAAVPLGTVALMSLWVYPLCACLYCYSPWWPTWCTNASATRTPWP